MNLEEKAKENNEKDCKTNFFSKSFEKLKNRFKRVFVLYDNDFQSEENHGRIYGETLAEKFGLLRIEIPEQWKSKDPSDLVKNHGREVLREVIYSLTK